MKKNFQCLLFFSSLFYRSKVELKKVTDSSQTFTGEIGGIPITVELSYTGIVDCDQYQHYVDGWYYYDKYKRKSRLPEYMTIMEICRCIILGQNKNRNQSF